MASYSVVSSTSSSVTINIKKEASNLYYEVFYRPSSSSTAIQTGLQYDTRTSFNYTIDGLSGSNYVINVAVSPTNSTLDSKLIGGTNLTYTSLTISFNANGGSGAPSATTYYGFVAGSYGYTSVLFPYASSIKRDGYEFLGWSTNSSATEASYDNGQSFGAWYLSTGSDDNTTLYAVWKKTDSIYTAYLSYNANGGSGAPSRTEHTFASNPVEAIISSVEPTRDGYTFAGWWLYNIESHGTYAAGSKIKVEGSTNKTTALNNYNHMLYAQWKKGDGAGVAWVYDGKWKEAIPYVYDGKWKEAGANVYYGIWNETI